MPQPDPTAPPESITLQQWSGVKNTVTPERLKLDQLEAAVNVDLDDVGQLHRRRGYTLKDSNKYHSPREFSGTTYVVKNGMLGILRPDYSFKALTQVGDSRLDYTQVADIVYFSSVEAAGKIQNETVLPWGVSNDAGEWVSPVLRPTDTLGAISGKQLTRTPYASHIDNYKGRMYLAAGRVLWATELYLYDYVDRTRTYMYFENDITMVQAMTDGLYVGTEEHLYFLQGTLAEGLVRTEIISVGVVPGSDVHALKSRVHPQARTSPVIESGAIIFLTDHGIYAGFDGGEVYNMTRDMVVFPGVQAAAALYRDDLGVTSYVAVADSAGGPSANARIGDFADAEIRRFQGG